eukprot:SAG31_NODE_3337_length_4388_cov_3.372814_5_plen_152_part_00
MGGKWTESGSAIFARCLVCGKPNGPQHSSGVHPQTPSASHKGGTACLQKSTGVATGVEVHNKIPERDKFKPKKIKEDHAPTIMKGECTRAYLLRFAMFTAWVMPGGFPMANPKAKGQAPATKSGRPPLGAKVKPDMDIQLGFGIGVSSKSP